MASLQNGVAAHFQATTFFSMRTVSLASLQSCCSIDSDARCKHCLMVCLHWQWPIRRLGQRTEPNSWHLSLSRVNTWTQFYIFYWYLCQSQCRAVWTHHHTKFGHNERPFITSNFLGIVLFVAKEIWWTGSFALPETDRDPHTSTQFYTSHFLSVPVWVYALSTHHNPILFIFHEFHELTWNFVNIISNLIKFQFLFGVYLEASRLQQNLYQIKTYLI